VTVQIARNGRTTNVSVNVSAQVLDEAWQWARERKTVVVSSKIRSSREGLQAVTQDAIAPLMLDVKPS
jgi:lauroyl/myristoyl acyltransferase